MPISVPPIPRMNPSGARVDPNAISGIGDALTEAMDRRRQRGMENRTQEAFAGGIPLRPDGSPDYASMASRLFEAGNVDTGLGVTRLAETQVQNEYLRGRPMSVGGSLVDPNTYQELYRGPSADREASETFGLNPIYGQDEQGNTVLMQPSNRGGARQMDLPEGVSPSTGVERVDLGTAWGLIDKRSGQMVGTLPKDVAGEARQKELGKAGGEAAASLSADIAKANGILATIEGIETDPYLERGTGLSSVFNAVPATGGYDFAQKLQQLQGQAFLQAFNDLKGGGQITEVEGQKATQAIARLSAGQSEEAFKEAIAELKGVVTGSIARMKQRAGQVDLTAGPATPLNQPLDLNQPPQGVDPDLWRLMPDEDKALFQ